MSTGTLDFEIEQGADRTLQLQFIADGTLDTPVDLTGYTARAMIRDTDSGELLLDMSPFITFPDAAEGRVDITLPAATTAALTGWELMPWDLELESGTGSVSRPLRGLVTLVSEVTYG